MICANAKGKAKHRRRRRIRAYAIEAIRELDVAPGSFTEANRAWVVRHEARSVAAIGVATLRIVARNAGNVYQAAARLGLSQVSLGDGFRRRGLAK